MLRPPAPLSLPPRRVTHQPSSHTLTETPAPIAFGRYLLTRASTCTSSLPCIAMLPYKSSGRASRWRSQHSVSLSRAAVTMAGCPKVLHFVLVLYARTRTLSVGVPLFVAVCKQSQCRSQETLKFRVQKTLSTSTRAPRHVRHMLPHEGLGNTELWHILSIAPFFVKTRQRPHNKILSKVSSVFVNTLNPSLLMYDLFEQYKRTHVP